MDLNDILEAIRAGVGVGELTSMLEVFLADNPEFNEPGVLGDALVDAELSQGQQSLLNRAVSRANPGNVLDETPALAFGGSGVGLGAKATTGVFGTTARVGAPTAYRLSSSGLQLLGKAAQWIWGSKLGKVGLTTGVLGGGIAAVQGLYGDEIPGEPVGAADQVVNPGDPLITQEDEQGRLYSQGAFAFAPPEQQPGTTGPTAQQPFRVPDPGFNIMVVDHTGDLTGTPGAVAIVNSAELASQGVFPDPFISGAVGTGSLGTLSPELQEAAVGLNIDIQSSESAQSALGDREVRQVIFPESIGGGEITVGSPFQVEPSTSVVGAQSPFMDLRPQAPDIPESRAAFEQNIGAPEQVATTPQPVLAGATLSPRVFNQYQGRTLLEWAQISAQRHGVPLNLLYGIIQHESGWNPTAVGGVGEYGLAQIYTTSTGGPWPISKSQAFNPIFSLEWTAQKLSERFQQYGRWDAAVLAHNWPVAAQHLAQTGTFMADKAQKYVGSVMSKANASGLSDYIFATGDELPQVPGAGPTLPPFQTPDPAASRQYIKDLYEELLNREPTEGELSAGVDKITQLARSAYSANIKQAKGSESEEVDIEARFRESVEETGEFAFREETRNQRSFTDFASSIARILQEGV